MTSLSQSLEAHLSRLGDVSALSQTLNEQTSRLISLGELKHFSSKRTRERFSPSESLIVQICTAADLVPFDKSSGGSDSAILRYYQFLINSCPGAFFIRDQTWALPCEVAYSAALEEDKQGVPPCIEVLSRLRTPQFILLETWRFVTSPKPAKGGFHKHYIEITSFRVVDGAPLSPPSAVPITSVDTILSGKAVMLNHAMRGGRPEIFAGHVEGLIVALSPITFRTSSLPEDQHYPCMFFIVELASISTQHSTANQPKSIHIILDDLSMRHSCLVNGYYTFLNVKQSTQCRTILDGKTIYGTRCIPTDIPSPPAPCVTPSPPQPDLHTSCNHSTPSHHQLQFEHPRKPRTNSGFPGSVPFNGSCYPMADPADIANHTRDPVNKTPEPGNLEATSSTSALHSHFLASTHRSPIYHSPSQKQRRSSGNKHPLSILYSKYSPSPGLSPPSQEKVNESPMIHYSGMVTDLLPLCNAMVLDGSMIVLLHMYPAFSWGRGWRLGAELCLYNVHLLFFRGKHVGFTCCSYSDIRVLQFSADIEHPFKPWKLQKNHCHSHRLRRCAYIAESIIQIALKFPSSKPPLTEAQPSHVLSQGDQYELVRKLVNDFDTTSPVHPDHQYRGRNTCSEFLAHSKSCPASCPSSSFLSTSRRATTPSPRFSPSNLDDGEYGDKKLDNSAAELEFPLFFITIQHLLHQISRHMNEAIYPFMLHSRDIFCRPSGDVASVATVSDISRTSRSPIAAVGRLVLDPKDGRLLFVDATGSIPMIVSSGSESQSTDLSYDPISKVGCLINRICHLSKFEVHAQPYVEKKNDTPRFCILVVPSDIIPLQPYVQNNLFVWTTSAGSIPQRPSIGSTSTTTTVTNDGFPMVPSNGIHDTSTTKKRRLFSPASMATFSTLATPMMPAAKEPGLVATSPSIITIHSDTPTSLGSEFHIPHHSSSVTHTNAPLQDCLNTPHITRRLSFSGGETDGSISATSTPRGMITPQTCQLWRFELDCLPDTTEATCCLMYITKKSLTPPNPYPLMQPLSPRTPGQLQSPHGYPQASPYPSPYHPNHIHPPPQPCSYSSRSKEVLDSKSSFPCQVEAKVWEVTGSERVPLTLDSTSRRVQNVIEREWSSISWDLAVSVNVTFPQQSIAQLLYHLLQERTMVAVLFPTQTVQGGIQQNLSITTEPIFLLVDYPCRSCAGQMHIHIPSLNPSSLPHPLRHTINFNCVPPKNVDCVLTELSTIQGNQVLIPCLKALVLHGIPGSQANAMAKSDKGDIVVYLCDPTSGKYVPLYGCPGAHPLFVVHIDSKLVDGCLCLIANLIFKRSKQERPWVRLMHTSSVHVLHSYQASQSMVSNLWATGRSMLASDLAPYSPLFRTPNMDPGVVTPHFPLFLCAKIRCRIIEVIRVSLSECTPQRLILRVDDGTTLCMATFTQPAAILSVLSLGATSDTKLQDLCYSGVNYDRSKTVPSSNVTNSAQQPAESEPVSPLQQQLDFLVQRISGKRCVLLCRPSLPYRKAIVSGPAVDDGVAVFTTSLQVEGLGIHQSGDVAGEAFAILDQIRYDTDL